LDDSVAGASVDDFEGDFRDVPFLVGYALAASSFLTEFSRAHDADRHNKHKDNLRKKFILRYMIYVLSSSKYMNDS
jgi:hypothetical protein